MSRLAGPQGAVYVKISGIFTKVADVYDWEFGADTKMRDISIKMDAIDRWIPSHAENVRFTAKRRHEGTSAFAPYVSDSAANATYTTWRLDLIDNNASYLQITCNGYAMRSRTTVPQEGIDETFELQIDDSYTFSM